VIRVAIADDQPLVRAGLRSLFDHADDISVVAEAQNGREAVEVVRENQPDVVLMDIRMPLLDGIAATQQIVGNPSLQATRVLILTTFDLDDYVYAALEAGASGFLLKDAPPERVFDAVRVVASGHALIDPVATRRLIESFTDARRRAAPDDTRRLATLTDREREVLRLVGQGLSNGEISERLVVSEATTKTHVSRLLAKLHARDRAQLVVVAYETGVVAPGGA
jgi:DNA-binding NarL/FixJ family response regulator